MLVGSATGKKALLLAAPLAASLAASACSLKVETPSSMPYVQVFDLAEFGDTLQDYASSLARADTDGDGVDELVCGCPARDVDDDGIVLFVETVGLTVVNVMVPWRSPGETSAHHDEFGRALAIGDWNRDGRPDVAVGDPNADVDAASGTVAQSGEVWVCFGPIDTTRATRLRATTPLTGARFGATLASGDFDGDGFADLAIGAPHPADLSAGADDPGVEVFFGPDLARHEKWDAQGGGGRFGAALVAIPGDAGSALLVAGAPEAGSGSVQNGDAFAWQRTEGAGPPRRLASAPPSDAGFGCAGECGDFDGDGQPDLALVAPIGRGGVYFFDLVTLGERGQITLPPPLSGRRGAPVVAFGDVSRDGADELVLLSAGYAEPASVLFSPGHGAAHLELNFAAAAAIVGNCDFDPEPELLFATPTSFKPTGGFSVLRVLDFSWQEVRSQGARAAPIVIPGVSQLLPRQ